MTADIKINHHGSSGAEPATRGEMLESKEQTDGFGVRGMAAIFIGFAVYLKSFFTPTEAANSAIAADAMMPASPQADEDNPAAVVAADDAIGMPGAAKQRSAGSDVPEVAATDAANAGTTPSLILANPPTISDTLATIGGQRGDIFRLDTGYSDTIGATSFVSAAREEPGMATGIQTLSAVGSGRNTTDGRATSGQGPTPDSPPSNDASGPYDLATLFRDMGSTLQNRPDELVDRVTDLAIGDLMREMTLADFPAHLGPVLPDSGRAVDRLVNVLSDDASRDAFLERSGLAGFDLHTHATDIPASDFASIQPDTDAVPDLFF